MVGMGMNRNCVTVRRSIHMLKQVFLQYIQRENDLSHFLFGFESYSEVLLTRVLNFYHEQLFCCVGVLYCWACGCGGCASLLFDDMLVENAKWHLKNMPWRLHVARVYCKYTRWCRAR